MTGFVRKATLVGLFGVLAASAALANVPDCAHSSFNPWLNLVGYKTDGVTPDPNGAYTIVIRDFANNPISGATVQLDFSDCCDINVCSGQPGLSGCVPPVVSGVTDAVGSVTFSVTGAAKDNGIYVPTTVAQNGAKTACMRLVAGTTDCGKVARVLAYDQDGSLAAGSAGVTALDYSITSSLLKAVNTGGAGNYRDRANYSGPSLADVAITALDLSFCSSQIARNNLGQGTSKKCPGGYCTSKVAGPNCP